MIILCIVLVVTSTLGFFGLIECIDNDETFTGFLEGKCNDDEEDLK